MLAEEVGQWSDKANSAAIRSVGDPAGACSTSTAAGEDAGVVSVLTVDGGRNCNASLSVDADDDDVVDGGGGGEG